MDELTVKVPGAGQDPAEVAAAAATDARAEDVLWFNARLATSVTERLPENRPYPVYLEDDLVGFFVFKPDSCVKVFLSKDAKPLNLFLSSGMEFYFSVRAADRDFTYGLVGEIPVGANSVKVRI